MSGSIGETSFTEHRITTDTWTLTMEVGCSHLRAHGADFFMPYDRLLELVGWTIEDTSKEAHVELTVAFEAAVGLSRCVKLHAGDAAFWGRRDGRSTPSHLLRGPAQPTRHLSICGDWISPDRFRLLSAFAGEHTPREIDDPDLPLDGIDESVAFWTTHALVVDDESSATF